MTTFPGSPKLLKGGLVLIDPDSGATRRVIVLQYNPITLTRTLQAQSVGESGDRSQALRLKAPPVETYKIEAEVDAADQLEFPDRNRTVVDYGIYPQLAALETLVYPESGKLQSNNALANAGTMEIIPIEAPLTLFVWSQRRVVPVRVTEFSITEEAFDPALNPLRARVNLGFRVLNVNDLGFEHPGGNLYMTYHQQLERLAGLNPLARASDLGF